MMWDLTQECDPSSSRCPNGSLDHHRRGLCGTRVFAPAEWDGTRRRLEQYALDRMVTVVQTVDVRGAARVSAAILEQAWPKEPAAPAAMLVTGQHHYWGTDQYFRSQATLTVDAADYIGERAVGLLIVDGPGLVTPDVCPVLAAQDVLLVTQVTIPLDLPRRFLGMIAAARMLSASSAPARLLAMD